MSILAYALGVWVLQGLAILPGPETLRLATIVLAIYVALLLRLRATPGRAMRRLAIVALAFACGFVWAAWRAEWRLGDALPMTWESRDIEVVGVVSSLPQMLDGPVRFVLRTEESKAPLPRYIQVSWYPRTRGPGSDVPQIRPGERWRLTVRLKRPHGFVNPHGFDYEAWLLERNIRATGYVRHDAANVRLAPFLPGLMNYVHSIRDAVRERYEEGLSGRPHGGILIALAIGDQRAISLQHWDVFRRTAVAHLVSISGLHVSLVALIGGGLVSGMWRRIPPLVVRCPARKAGALAGLLCAAGYALLAGMGLPTQRALIMLTVAALALILGRETAGSRVMAVALFFVLLVDPWAVLSPGFWLSFGAVGVILYLVSGRMQREAGWRAAVKIQLAITLATTPLLLALFNAFSLVAPLANAVAIPLVSFLITPLVLLAVVLPVPALLEIAHWITGGMMVWLDWLAQWPYAMMQGPSAPGVLIAAALVGVGWLLLPRGAPARHVAVFALVPLLAWTPARPVAGAFRAVVLDVGQGLAVHVQTASHDLVYDAGPPYGPVADAGSRVLLPYFAGASVARLHKLVLSHGDSDHIGGAASLLSALRVDALASTLDPGHALLSAGAGSVSACVGGESWEWDGVRFEFLHPSPELPSPRTRNGNSCVLRVSADGGSLLLPGDIEAAAERSLVARSPARLASDVVVVPHHGSRSSSSPAFVRHTGASHAIHSAGNLNAFRHPHPAVWARWAEAGARNWRTDGQGAIIVDVGSEGVSVQSERARSPKYWHGR